MLKLTPSIANQSPPKDSPDEISPVEAEHYQLLKEKLSDLLDSFPEIGKAERRSVLHMTEQGRLTEAIDYLHKFFPDTLNPFK